MNYQDPYGLNVPDSPVADHVIRIYQADDTIIMRQAADPFSGMPCTPENCHLEFTVVNRRFDTVILFKADWVKGIVQKDGGRVQITIPSKSTLFERGSLLYSLTWYDILRAERKVLEEGYFLVEYSADAPNPEVPYNVGDKTRKEQAYGF